jgi:hypothetical protein
MKTGTALPLIVNGTRNIIVATVHRRTGCISTFRGRDRQMDIEEYIWRQLDLDNSYQSEVLYGGDDEDYEPEIDDNFKKVDVYLLETSGWGGLRR